MSALRRTIAGRVARLRALALDAAATPAEVETATILADRLVARYGADAAPAPALADPLSVPAVPRTPDDLDPRGIWGGRRAAGRGLSVTATLMGDPAPGRSALDQLRGAA